ncbi:helix-turn-helix transcriptional regulator [Amycolatopsis oliviviridis]|uniref:Transcriptional regulator n=1 Tax=Amycolatopsis oliviviridis TaxID=1471590 RepID=A0ABQ3LLT6_9PSEU|nr:helix-turn-helix transcriptional regulator [Amycolatopsis oliviviridis]GHH16865.1 transcriptional regulator [Amycolatopsis oliviviridis]
MTETAELGDFLKARRAALDPADLGLPTGFNQRRVAGLRREELAQLAGISVDYYTRLEQGRARNVSDSVLESLSRALRLHRDEETYLRNLAAPKRKRVARPRAQRVRPELQLMLNAIQSPAFVFGRYLDVLAWNPLGGALSFDFSATPPGERNIPKMFFLDEHAREMHPEWTTVAREVVANLRSESGKYPDDPYLAQLVGELSLGSEEFRKLWAKHTVREKAHAWKVMINPIVGELRLRYETLRLPDEPELALVIYTAEPGSDSERALGLLASWVADPAHA